MPKSTCMTPEQVIRKQRIKNAVYTALGGVSFFSGVTPVRLALRTEPLLRVLIYYKINSIPGNTLSMSADTFTRQMRFLKRHYTVITPEQLVAVQCEGGTLPRNAVLLTFDDGYRDVYERAYPVLKDLGLRAFLFPATDYVGGSRPFPHDERLPMPNPVLNWSQLRAMDDVFAIGSHTRSHRVLTRLPRNEAEEEIVASKALIEDRLGRPVQFFCYPKGATGDFSQPLEDIVEAAGYRGSFVTLTGPNTVPAVRRGKWLRRYHVDPLGGFTFARLLDGSCDAIGLKDLSWGVAAKRRFNAWLGTMTR